MAGLGDEMAAATPGRGRLRASNADREQVIGALKVAFVEGRLTEDEFDARLGQVYASRTYAELAEVTADIPTGLTGIPALARPLAGDKASRAEPYTRYFCRPSLRSSSSPGDAVTPPWAW